MTRFADGDTNRPTIDFRHEPDVLLRDPLAVLSPEERARFERMPTCYRKDAIMEALGNEARNKIPRRNQTIQQVLDRQKRRDLHQLKRYPHAGVSVKNAP